MTIDKELRDALIEAINTDKVGVISAVKKSNIDISDNISDNYLLRLVYNELMNDNQQLIDNFDVLVQKIMNGGGYENKSSIAGWLRKIGLGWNKFIHSKKIRREQQKRNAEALQKQQIAAQKYAEAQARLQRAREEALKNQQLDDSLKSSAKIGGVSSVGLYVGLSAVAFISIVVAVILIKRKINKN